MGMGGRSGLRSWLENKESVLVHTLFGLTLSAVHRKIETAWDAGSTPLCPWEMMRLATVRRTSPFERWNSQS